jgi:hypothetical protein
MFEDTTGNQKPKLKKKDKTSTKHYTESKF